MEQGDRGRRQWEGAMDDEKRNPKLLAALMLMGGAVVGGVVAWVILGGIKLRGAGPELTLPMIVIVGVVVLLATLALVAFAFSLLNLTDRTQPLALPEGSVRAVIALMLLLVFAIAAIFLYSNVASSGKIQVWASVPEDQLDSVRRQVNVVWLQPNPAPQAQAGATPPKQTYTVHYRDNSAAGDDMAKQLIVLLGTLVTAVASFYFGSSSVSSARDAAERTLRGGGGPNAKSVRPATLKPDGSAQQLTIAGDNLGSAVGVELRLADGRRIAADGGSVKAAATSVVCTVTIPAGTPTGPCDVVVSDNANNDSTVPKAVTISA
jgi:uncharacterized membrane protein YqjE